MKLLKKISLAAFATCLLCIASSVPASAQHGRARWEGNSGRHLGWTMGRHNGWNKRTWNGRWRDRDSRYSTMSYWRYRNMLRNRALNRTYNRTRYYSPASSLYQYQMNQRTTYRPYRYYRRNY
jgi:hypothetical protein